MNILVRESKADDIPFVFDTYLKSWRTSKYAGVVPNHLFFEVHRTGLEDLLARGAKVLVAHFEDKPDTILGWACSEVKEGRCVLHYVYIRDSLEGFEIANKLVDAVPGTKPGFVTHKMFLAALKNWTHAPEIARRKSL